MITYEPVFLLAGQSNMAGRCEEAALPKEILTKLEDENSLQEQQQRVSFTFCWKNDSNFGQPSLGESNHLTCQASPGLNKNLFGPEFGLAESLRSCLLEEASAPKEVSAEDLEQQTTKPPTRVHFVKFAMGSTNLHSNWNPSNTNDGESAKPAKKAHYREFIDFCQESMENLNLKLNQESQSEDDADGTQKATVVPKWAGMFWLQGESDSSKAKDAKNYLANLQTFLTAVRADLGAPDLHVVVSPVVWNGKYVDIVNQALFEAGNGAIPDCTCIDKLDVERYGVQPEEAGVCAHHLTGEGVTDIGRRMGMAFPVPAGSVWR